MELREKVIKGLECCMINPDLCDRTNCPYAGTGDDNNYCDVQLIKDTIALLKAQEPRVMTLEEVKAMKRYTICAVEQRSKVLHATFNAEYRGTLTIGERNYLDFGLYVDVNPFRRTGSDYGKTWRCWTSRPTDAQMEAIPWESVK